MDEAEWRLGMSNLKPCPRCGSKDIGHHCEIRPMGSWCYCFCECGQTGPSAPSQEQARAAWNDWVSSKRGVSPIAERGARE